MTVRSILLVAAALVLAAYAAFDRWSKGSLPSTGSPQSTAARRTGATAQTGHPFAELTLDRLRDTIERPLFDPTRKVRRTAPPPPPPVAQPIEPVRQAAAPDVRLIGIVVGPQTFALLTRSGQQKAIQVEVGSIIDGWQVSEIGARSLTLANQSRTVSLRVEKQRN